MEAPNIIPKRFEERKSPAWQLMEEVLHLLAKPLALWPGVASEGFLGALARTGRVFATGLTIKGFSRSGSRGQLVFRSGVWGF